jgi:rhodanese-related sulfurtransferase
MKTGLMNEQRMQIKEMKMKKTVMFSLVLAAAIALSGCCSPCKHSRSDGKCSACAEKAGKSCPHCGMQKEQCKCPAKDSSAATVNTAALKALIRSGTPLTLVDARVGKYDDGRRIPNALNLSPEAQASEIQRVLPSKEALIVTYCGNLKCPASSMLAARLNSLGYKHVLKYPQGIEGWVKEGNAVTQIAK